MTFDATQKDRLLRGASAFGLALMEAQVNQCAGFAERLEIANQTLNLTRVPPQDYATLHFLDSLALAAFWKPGTETTLIDVGTGAGFPGVPLAIAFPQLRVTLLDATRKRLAFLDQALGEIRLNNVRTLHARAEEAAKLPKHRYDVVVARAVSRLPQLMDWLLPLVRPGGIAVAYKSQDISEELKEAEKNIRRHACRLERVAEIPLPETDIVRKLVVLRRSMR